MHGSPTISEWFLCAVAMPLCINWPHSALGIPCLDSYIKLFSSQQ